MWPSFLNSEISTHQYHLNEKNDQTTKKQTAYKYKAHSPLSKSECAENPRNTKVCCWRVSEPSNWSIRFEQRNDRKDSKSFWERFFSKIIHKPLENNFLSDRSGEETTIQTVNAHAISSAKETTFKKIRAFSCLSVVKKNPQNRNARWHSRDPCHHGRINWPE